MNLSYSGIHHWRWVFLISSTFVLVFFTFTLITSLFLVPRKGVEDDRIENLNMYQYLVKDHNKREVSYGIGSFFEEIEDFRSYEDFTSRKEFLISRFGNEEFECYGSCFCEDQYRRSGSSQTNVLIKGASYLVAAVSSYVAIEVASEYLSERCGDEYSRICSEGSIRTELDGCEKVVKNGYGDEEERRLYFCYGNCVQRMDRKYRPLASDQGIDCTKFKKEAKIEVFLSEVTLKAAIMDNGSKMNVKAKHKFQREYLLDFCKEVSRIEYDYSQTAQSRKGKVVGYMCSSRTRKKGLSNYQNVKCRQIEPETKAYNRKWREKAFWEEKRKWDES